MFIWMLTYSKLMTRFGKSFWILPARLIQWMGNNTRPNYWTTP